VVELVAERGASEVFQRFSVGSVTEHWTLRSHHHHNHRRKAESDAPEDDFVVQLPQETDRTLSSYRRLRCLVYGLAGDRLVQKMKRGGAGFATAASFIKNS
jgi:hypothetical protein